MFKMSSGHQILQCLMPSCSILLLFLENELASLHNKISLVLVLNDWRVGHCNSINITVILS